MVSECMVSRWGLGRVVFRWCVDDVLVVSLVSVVSWWHRVGGVGEVVLVVRWL